MSTESKGAFIKKLKTKELCELCFKFESVIRKKNTSPFVAFVIKSMSMLKTVFQISKSLS